MCRYPLLHSLFHPRRRSPSSMRRAHLITPKTGPRALSHFAGPVSFSAGHFPISPRPNYSGDRGSFPAALVTTVCGKCNRWRSLHGNDDFLLLPGSHRPLCVPSRLASSSHIRRDQFSFHFRSYFRLSSFSFWLTRKSRLVTSKKIQPEESLPQKSRYLVN